jgi:hypothetical protein
VPWLNNLLRLLGEFLIGVDLFVHVRSKDCVLVEVFVYLFGSDMLLKLFPASKNGIGLISEIDSR